MHRYGPQGSFWATHPRLPRLPIHMWQIWNEPGFDFYWPQPFAASYVPVLAAAHAAIKAADPSAQVVLPGFPDWAWQFLATVYEQGGGVQRDFDVVAAHPYTQNPVNVIRFLRLMRTVMREYGDGTKPIMITETGWNSSLGHHPNRHVLLPDDAAGQAQAVRTLLPVLGRAPPGGALAGLLLLHVGWAGRRRRLLIRLRRPV